MLVRVFEGVGGGSGGGCAGADGGGDAAEGAVGEVAGGEDVGVVGALVEVGDDVAVLLGVQGWRGGWDDGFNADAYEEAADGE